MSGSGIPVVGQFIDTYHAGGAERVVLDLSRRLLERGVGVEVLHIGNEWLAPACDEIGVPHRVLPWRDEFKHKSRYASFVRHFSRYLQQRHLALLHSHLLGPVTGAALPARLAGVPAIGTLHDTYSVMEKALSMRLLDAAALLGTRLVTVSGDMQSTFEQRVRLPSTRFVTVYNGTAHPPTDDAGPDRRRVRSELGLAHDDVVAVSVGRLNPVKGYDDLLRAWATLHAPMRLLVVGQGELNEALRRLTAQLGLADRVTFLGFRHDVTELLHAADLFVLASRSEGLSCSLIEAMGAGLPAVVTDVGGNRELIEEGRTGYLVAPGDLNAFSERLSLLQNDPESRRRFGQKASQRARALFGIDAMVDQYLRIYAQSDPRFAKYSLEGSECCADSD